MTDFSTTRWAEWYTSGRSANGSASIDKAKMPYLLQHEYQAREYISQALTLLDSTDENLRDLSYIANVLNSAISRLEDAQEQ